MAKGKNRKMDVELERLENELQHNEELMREAAIKYQALIDVKKNLTATIKARREGKVQVRE